MTELKTVPANKGQEELRVAFVRTPLRVSLIGGGSDLRSFYESEPGGVLSAAINRYIDVIVRKRHDRLFRLVTSETTIVDDVQFIEDKLLRAVFDYKGVRCGIDVCIISDVTSKGSGLGASSATVVGLLKAIEVLDGQCSTPADLADSASHVEIERAGRHIGKQDHYPPAFGGLRAYKFFPDESVVARPLHLDMHVCRELEQMLVLYDTGMHRDAAHTIESQVNAIPMTERRNALRRFVALAQQLANDLEGGSLDTLGPIFDEAWQVKRALGATANQPQLDDIYERAVSAGAIGGKLLGAGAGGHFLFLVPPERRSAFNKALGHDAISSIRIEPQGAASLLKDPLLSPMASAAAP